MPTEQAAAATAESALPESLNVPDLAALLTQRSQAKSTPEVTESPDSKTEETATEEPDLSQEEQQTEEAPEASAEPEQSEDAEATEESDVDTEEPENQGEPDWVKKRLAKMAAQKNELKSAKEQLEAKMAALAEEKAQLEQQLQESSSAVASPSPDDPISFVKTEKDLVALDNQIKGYMDAVADYVDSEGVDVSQSRLESLKALSKTFDITTSEGELSLPKLRRALRTMDDLRKETIPKKAWFFQEESKRSREAEAKYAFWNKRDSEEYKLAQQAVQAFPELKRYPGWKEAASVFVEGMMAIKAREAAKAKPKPKTEVKVAPKVKGATAVVNSRAPVKDPGLAAKEQFRQSGGSVKDLSKLFASRSGK